MSPLYVDLDGSLLRGDSLHEACVRLLLHPSKWPKVVAALFRGKAPFKQAVMESVDLSAAALPYRKDFVIWLRLQKESGRKLILATGADREIAERIAAHLNLFDEVLASDGKTNLTGGSKLAAIKAHAGGQPVAYAGNEAIDLEIWNECESAVLVGSGLKYEKQIKSSVNIEQRFSDNVNQFKSIIRLLRPHQWAKNTLIFLPAAAAHQLASLPILKKELALFIAFSLCASGVYAANDLSDLASDRQHSHKKNRPLASGAVTIPAGLVLATLLPLLGFFIGWLALGIGAMAMIGAYWIITTYYSFSGKRIPLLDVFLLAGLYTFRAVAGALPLATGMSEWMAAFLLFLFFSLACLKRFAELLNLTSTHQGKIAGRGYIREDYLLMGLLGVGSAFAATLVICLYAASPVVVSLYPHPFYLMAIAPAVLFGLARFWLQAWRGELHNDPVVHALKDRVSYLLIILCGLAMAAATYL
jgi:4-hydroxybenzoate polyprenyltransferase